MVDFSRRTSSERDLQPVAIVTVDPVTRTATGVTRTRHTVTINCSYATGDTITIPAVGEQWYVERFDMEWRLYGRIPFNDATLNIEPEEGQVSVGSASGPLELNGTEVRANGTVFRLNGVWYRDDGETLQRSVDKITWESISAQAAGIILMISNALADFPDVSAIQDYLDEISTEESDALDALKEWASGLGSAWDAVCENPFFVALRQLGTGLEPLEQAVTGFQNFINTLWNALFCGFTGDLTPQLALTGVQGISDFLANNPFIQGLAALLDNPIGNLLFDSVTGATEFLQQIINILFCNFTGDLTPQNIIAAINGIFDPLINNPFIQGLATLADTLGSAVGNLFQDAIAGATGLIDTIFRVIFCDFTGDLTPQDIISHIGTLLTPLQNNPFIVGLGQLAETLGTAVGNLAADAISGATGLIEAIFRLMFCDFEGDLTPQDIITHITNLLDPLINNPFIQGLATLATTFGTNIGNLAADAISGATGLIDAIFRLMFCDFEGDLTPQDIISHITNLIDPLVNNVFIQGLATLATTFGTGIGNLAADAILGATGFLDALFRTIFCDFTGDLTPQDVISHINGLIDPLRTNPFIVALGQLAETLQVGIGNLAYDAIAGATGLVEAIFRAIFCDFSADFTPQNIIAKLADVLSTITTNPFVSGLITFAEGLGHTIGGGIEKAFAGANELLEAIFNIFFCDNVGVPTPQLLIDSIGGIIDLIRTNPLIVGLVEFIEAVGTTSTGFLTKALEGAFEFFNQIVNALFCNLPGQPTPAEIMASLTAIISSFTNNPYVAMLRALATALGDTSTNIFQQVLAGVTGIFDWFVDLLNTLVPFFDWSQIKTLDFPAMMSGLLTNLNPLAFLGPDGFLPLEKLPEIAFDMLTGLADFLQDNIFGPLENAILGALDGTLTGGLAALNTFFDGALGTGGSLLQQVANAMTGVGTFSTGPLSTISSLFSGITLGGGNLISQITGTLDEFVTNLDIAAIVSNITGIDINSLPENPLDALADFFGDLNAFTGANTLVQQILAQAGADLIPLVSGITGIAEGSITDAVATATAYFTNFRSLFSMDFGSGFNLASARNALIGILNNATAGLLSGSLINSLNISQVSNLITYVTGKVTGGTAADIQTMFTNLRTMFTTGGTFTLLPGGIFSIANAANAFIVNVLSQATTAIGSVKIPALAIANLSIEQISNLISTLTGGGSLAEFTNFFTNLRKFLGIGSGAGLFNFLVDPGSFNLVSALNAFIGNVLNQATQSLTATIIPDLGIDKISNLIGYLTGTGTTAADVQTFFANLRTFLGGNFLGGFSVASAAGALVTSLNQSATLLNSGIIPNLSIDKITNLVSTLTGGSSISDLQTFFTNIRTMFNVGTGPGQLNLLATQTAETLQNALYNIVSAINSTVNAFITQTGLSSWLGAADLTEIGNFFTNLVRFFNIDDFSVAPGSFNLGTTAGSFIDGVINQAVGTLIDPAKVLSTTGSGSLVTDLGLRPLATTLETWFTVVDSNSSYALQKFISNLRSVLGLQAVDLLPAGVFDPATAQLALHNVVSAINGGLADSLKWATQAGLDTKAAIDAIVEAITGTAGANTLAAIETLFSGLSGLTGTSILSKFTTLITGGTVPLSEFFAGLTAVTTTSNSLVHKIISSITGDTGTVQTLQKLGTFFGSINGGTATTLIGKIVEHLTGIIAKGLSGMTLENFFSGFNTTSTATGSLAYKVAQAVGGSTATNLSQITNLFDNLRTFLGIGTTGMSLATFLASPATFATNLTSVIQAFITNVLQKSGLSTVFVTLTGGATQIAENLIPNLSVTKISSLVSALTGSGTSLTDLQNFFANVRTFLGSSGFLVAPGSFSLATAAESFISNVLRNAGVVTKLVSLNAQNLIDTNLINNLSIDKITSLVSYLTGAGTTPAQLQTFFTNLRSLLNIGTGAGQVNWTTAQTAGTLQNALFGIVSSVNSTLNTFLTQSGMLSWLGAADLTEIGNFFTNLRSFMTGLNLTSGTFSLPSAIDYFLKNNLGILDANGNLKDTLLPVISAADIDQLQSWIQNNVLGGSSDLLAWTRTNILDGRDSLANWINLDVLAGQGTLPMWAKNTILDGRDTVAQWFSDILGPVDTLAEFVLNTVFGTTSASLESWMRTNITDLITGSPGGSLATFFTNLRSMFSGIDFLSGSFSPQNAVNALLSLVFNPSSLPFLNDDGQLDVGVVGGLTEWARENVIIPVTVAFLTGLKVDFTKFGINTPEDMANINLGTLGDVAGSLLTSFTEIPAQLLSGILPPGLLGKIPVSNISNSSENLLSQGAFGTSSSIESSDGWSWDGGQNAPGGTGGSARVVVSSAKNRYLYSQQAIPVAPGDRLVLTAKVKTNGLVGTTPISIALVPFAGTEAQTPIPIGSPIGSSVNWTDIGQAANTHYEVINSTWTTVIVRLGVSSAATAGTVFWDEISLTKVGGLLQDNVSDLTTVWQNIWDSVFPTAGGTVDWTSVESAMSQLLSVGKAGISAGEAAAGDAALADTKAQTTLNSLYEALSGSPGERSAADVKYAFQVLNGILFGTNTIANTLTDTAIPSLDAGKIGSGTFGTSRIADDAITTAKIGPAAVTAAEIGTYAVTTEKIAGYAVTSNRLAQDSVTNFAIATNAVNQDSIASNAVGEAQIYGGAVTSAKIATDAVTSAKIATNAVTNDAIYPGAVTATEIANYAVGTNQLNTDAVTNAKIATNAVNQDSIASSAVGTDQLASYSIISNKLATDAVTNHAIAPGAVTGTEISTYGITATNIATDAIINRVIATDAVNADSIATNAVTTDAIYPLAVTTAELATDAVTNAKIATDAVNSDSIATGGVATANLSNLAVTSDKVQGVDGTKINTGTVSAARLDINGVGQQINPTAGSGAQLVRIATEPMSVSSGRNFVPTNFFTRLNTASTDIKCLTSAGAEITTVGNRADFAGAFKVTLAGWYMVELAARMTVGFGGGAMNAAPVIFKGTTLAGATAFKVGTDNQFVWLVTTTVSPRFIQNSFIVYLNANEIVRAGFDVGYAGIAGGPLLGGQSGAGTSETETYFSISLLNKSYA